MEKYYDIWSGFALLMDWLLFSGGSGIILFFPGGVFIYFFISYGLQSAGAFCELVRVVCQASEFRRAFKYSQLCIVFFHTGSFHASPVTIFFFLHYEFSCID